jgi:hypothetical protein
MSKPKPLTSLGEDLTLSSSSVAVDTRVGAFGTLTDAVTASSYSVDSSYYDWMLDKIPEDVLKEYYLRKYTKLGRKLNGEE